MAENRRLGLNQAYNQKPEMSKSKTLKDHFKLDVIIVGLCLFVLCFSDKYKIVHTMLISPLCQSLCSKTVCQFSEINGSRPPQVPSVEGLEVSDC